MKRIVLLITLLIGFNTFSQKKGKFKPGVKIIELKKIEEYKKPKSILFVFKGHTHSINYFLDLEKRVRRSFKDIRINFNYHLNAENSLQSDLQKIPSIKYNKNNYEATGYISITDFKIWNNNVSESNKLNYNLNFKMEDLNLNSLITLKLNVNSYSTILTQNKKLNKAIYKAILEN